MNDETKLKLIRSFSPCSAAGVIEYIEVNIPCPVCLYLENIEPLGLCIRQKSL
jgi:hypothetical protein